MSQSDQSQGAQGESDWPAKVPLAARPLMRESFSARRAALIIAVFTLLVTVGGGISERLFDRPEFPTIRKGLWFGLETVTTVGYGDVTPARVVGRIIAAVVMLAGIGFIAVITASVTAGLVESSRRRLAESEHDLARRLEEVRELLVRIEAGINQQQPKA
jgi:voltage-gated potassium channel Kch